MVCEFTGLKMSKVAGRHAVYVPHHPSANSSGYVPRYRFIMEMHVKRILNSNEEVHHKNEDKLDDRLDNLEILTTREHIMQHRPWEYHRTKVDREHVQELMNIGLGNRKIAKRLGYSTSTIKRILKVLRGGKIESIGLTK